MEDEEVKRSYNNLRNEFNASLAKAGSQETKRTCIAECHKHI